MKFDQAVSQAIDECIWSPVALIMMPGSAPSSMRGTWAAWARAVAGGLSARAIEPYVPKWRTGAHLVLAAAAERTSVQSSKGEIQQCL